MAGMQVIEHILITRCHHRSPSLSLSSFFFDRMTGTGGLKSMRYYRIRRVPSLVQLSSGTTTVVVVVVVVVVGGGGCSSSSSNSTQHLAPYTVSYSYFCTLCSLYKNSKKSKEYDTAHTSYSIQTSGFLVVSLPCLGSNFSPSHWADTYRLRPGSVRLFLFTRYSSPDIAMRNGDVET